MILTDALARLLFPPRCVLCGKLLQSRETDLCHPCRTDAPEYTGSRKRLRFAKDMTAVWYYEGSVRKSILRFKFWGKRGYAKCYGRMLGVKLEKAHPEGFEMITWVPTSRLRCLSRGYDQAQLLAVAVGEALGKQPVRLLEKKRNNRPQSGIVGEAKRRANVLGVYETVSKAQLAGKRILLVDDVITTGATAEEASRMLLTAGADSVYCGAVAVTRPRGKGNR